MANISATDETVKHLLDTYSATARDMQRLSGCSLETIYRCRRDGRLPAIRFSNSWRFRPADALSLIQTSGEPPELSDFQVSEVARLLGDAV